MTTGATGSSVNSHYLRQVVNLSEVMAVAASEDIFDANGNKLLAKGALMSRDMQEKLIVHRLRKPLESSIAVDGGITTKVIVGEAARLSESCAPLRRVLRATSGGASPLKLLSAVRLGNAMSMMLTMIERGGPRALEHCVMVSLIAICLAKKLGLDETRQSNVALAGLLHDIGELYIEPGYLNPHRRLLPHEWKHIVVHPRIGEMLIKDLAEYPPEVARAVAEHHERVDGSGYPRQLTGDEISVEGEILAAAEMISGVFTKNRPLDRAELALKIIPGEWSHALRSVISGTLRLPTEDNDAPRGGFDDVDAEREKSGEDVAALYKRLSTAHHTCEGLQGAGALGSAKARALLALALQRTGTIRRAFISTGLDVYLDEGRRLFETRDMEILFEKAVASKEIAWRLRDVARDLALQANLLDAREVSAFEPLIVLLDGRT
ncbi:MAG TPA: HD domain-containing phosphohydrolase [Burkholderiaceae bacterium]